MRLHDLNEMDSQGYSGSRDKKSHSKYGSRDDYNLGEPEVTLGADSIAKPKDVAKQGLSILHKSLDRALSKEKKASPVQVEKNKARWAQRQKEREQSVAEDSDNITAIFSGYSNYMDGRAANVFKHYGIAVLDRQHSEDEDISEYTVTGSKEALDKARAYLERSDQFGGMVLKQGVGEGLADDLAAFAAKHGGTVRYGQQPNKPMTAPSTAPQVQLTAQEREQLNLRLKELQAKFDPNYQYSDDYSFHSEQSRIAGEIASIKKKLGESVKGRSAIRQAMEAIDASQRKAKQVPSTEMPKKTSPVLGQKEKQHPFKGRAVGSN